MTWRTVLVLLAAAVLYLAGNSVVSLWDRDEPRYAQSSRQMLQSGDWVVPRLYDEIRANKPPLIYWAQAASMRLIGDEQAAGVFAARLPSAVAMLLTLTLLAVAVSRHVGAEQAFWTVFVLSSSLMTIVAAKVCLTDSVLLLWSTIAQLAIYAIWRGSRSWTPVIILATAMGLGGLTKPLLFLTLGGTVAILLLFRFFAIGSQGASVVKSDSRGLSKTFFQVIAGLIIVAAIILPWLMLVRHRAPEFLGQMTAEGRAHLEQGKEGHTGPPGYHLVLIWVTFFPWCLLLPMAIGLGIRYRGVPQVRFALAAVIGPWIVLEFFGTKLPHYILAAFPGLAYLTAHAAIRCLRGEDRDMESRPFIIGAGCWAAIVAALAVLPWLTVAGLRMGRVRIPKFEEQPIGPIILLSVVIVGYAVAVFLLLRARSTNSGQARRQAPALLVLGGGMLAIFLVAFTVYLPRLQFLRTSIRAADLLRKLGATRLGDAIMCDYKEPSLAFYQGGTIREQKWGFYRPKPFDQWPRWMVMTRSMWETLPPDSKARLHVVPDPENSIHGWAYSDTGKEVVLLVVEKNEQGQ